MENIGKKRTNVRRTKCESETECNSNGPTAEKKGRVHCQPLTWPRINYSLHSVTLHKPELSQTKEGCVRARECVCACV